MIGDDDARLLYSASPRLLMISLFREDGQSAQAADRRRLPYRTAIENRCRGSTSQAWPPRAVAAREGTPPARRSAHTMRRPAFRTRRRFLLLTRRAVSSVKILRHIFEPLSTSFMDFIAPFPLARHTMAHGRGSMIPPYGHAAAPRASSLSWPGVIDILSLHTPFHLIC